MILIALLFSSSIEVSAPSRRTNPISDACRYDHEKLALGFEAFDQDEKGGWRELADKPGCGDAAANLIRAYRMNYQERIPLLYWHEAQLRALDGDYSAAIPLMAKSRRPAARDDFGWNAYADATIAFLRTDRKALLVARRRLAAVKRPVDVPVTEEWPPNLTVVDALIRCFGLSYRIAYGGTCPAAGQDARR